MRLSDNERKYLQAICDNDFRTVAQVTQYCGFTRMQGLHYFRSLALGGLIDGFEPTYLGYKMLEGEPIEEGDADDRYGIRHEDVPTHGHHLDDAGVRGVGYEPSEE